MSPANPTELKPPRCAIALLICLSLQVPVVLAGQQKKKDAETQASSTSVTVDEASQLEAVITTDSGVIRLEFFPDRALKHVQHFIKLAREGFYNGSAFHRVIPRGIIQGGDPLLKDPATPRERWGTGGLNQLADEFSDLKHLRGTVSTVRIPNRSGSDGAQFFICSAPQPQLDGQFSIFGMVTEGLEVVDRISEVKADDHQLALAPVKIINVKVEAKKAEPFKDATLEQLRREVLLRTSLGDLTVETDPSLAPEHVRNFLKLVQTGWYDHTAFHRVVPGFVIQGGVGSTRAGSAGHPADRWVRKLKAEFNKTPHVRGVLSMARAADPDSAETSFFVVLGPAPHLDNKYTVFGRMIDGWETLELIEKVARDGEKPRVRVELIEAAIKP
jgi:cyclophilin family peptidyl-prolyl cis-trans isomerase